MEFLGEEQAIEAKHKLELEMRTDPTMEGLEFSSTKINWLPEKASWEICKSRAKDFMSERWKEENYDAIFLASEGDTIEGKPQPVHNTIQKITLIRRVARVTKGKDGQDNQIITQFKFLDEPYDKRYDGNLTSSWSQDLWVYRLIHKNKSYFILSYEELPLKNIKINGMCVEMNDFTELGKTMRIKSLARVFFLKNYEPTAKILEPEKIVEFTKDKKLDETFWFDLLDSHPLGTKNRFPMEASMLRSVHLLSSKKDGWPLHIGIIGPAGTRKSMGYIETIASKFEETEDIIEGGNSRIKGLTPSFKEKPANIGYLAKCERMGFVDELGKMIEFESNRHGQTVSNVLGELNFLLEHKKRMVGSGNDNDVIVKATSKNVFVTNPVKGKRTIYEHVGIMDPTFMSRIFWWVQDSEEQAFVLGEKGIEEIPPTPSQAYLPKEIRKEDEIFGYVWGGCERVGGISITKDEFITIFDTCNSFTCIIDPKKVQSLSDTTCGLAHEPMKGVWGPRSKHHIFLIIDGICKHRCLFKDYDPSFLAKEEDYDLAEKILFKMVRNWETDLSVKPKPDYTKGV